MKYSNKIFGLMEMKYNCKHTRDKKNFIKTEIKLTLSYELYEWTPLNC